MLYKMILGTMHSS